MGGSAFGGRLETLNLELKTVNSFDGCSGVAVDVLRQNPFLGKLPGDIHIKKENTEFCFPIVTSLVLSLGFSGLMRLISCFSKK